VLHRLAELGYETGIDSAALEKAAAHAAAITGKARK
jgi:hypothetical protein